MTRYASIDISWAGIYIYLQNVQYFLFCWVLIYFRISHREFSVLVMCSSYWLLKSVRLFSPRWLGFAFFLRGKNSNWCNQALERAIMKSISGESDYEMQLWRENLWKQALERANQFAHWMGMTNRKNLFFSASTGLVGQADGSVLQCKDWNVKTWDGSILQWKH